MKPRTKTESEGQGQFLMKSLGEMLDGRQPLSRLARAIDWGRFEREFEPLYRGEGRPGLPIRRMVGLLMLKQLCNLSDERVVEE
jgi:IS5 family transposase